MKVLEFIRHSTLLSVLAIGAIVLALQFPIGMIVGLVDERRDTRDEAVASVTQSLGTAQTIIAAVLAVPYTHQGRVETAYFLPDSIRLDADVHTQLRSRGIFSVRLYSAALKVSGTFAHPDFASWSVQDIHWAKASLLVGITDPRAIRSPVDLAWNGRPLEFATGTGGDELITSGIHAPLPSLKEPGTHEFSFELGLGGVDNVQFVPMGSSTTINVKSKWPDPSFTGKQLPTNREVSPYGFKASWQVLALTRSFPTQWRKGEVRTEALTESAFGVDFMSAVDTYKMNERSTKYQVLFFVLTFAVFYAFEFFCALRLHFMQYLLVGSALCLFYLLLLSLSEHTTFPLAYLAAAAGVVAMIGGYSWAILHAGRRALVVGGMLAGLYGFLYTLLQLSDYALLGGSIALFVILAGIMYATRRLNWRSIGIEKVNA
jgi:inner membrane protein